MPPEMPEELARLQEEERRRRGQGGGDSGESVGALDAVADSSTGNGWCDSGGCDVPHSSGCDIPDSSGCDSSGADSSGCDCDVPSCDCLLFFRLSALLGLVALLVPARDGGLVAGLVRLYRRRLTRFTPACPSSPSCSAYALDAIERLGPRRGLRAAAARVRSCGRATRTAA